MSYKTEFKHFKTSNGISIFRIPLEVFSKYYAHAFVVVYDGKSTLIDTGSGFNNSPDDLLAGFEQIRAEHHLDIQLETIDRVIVSHGHVDHFGGIRQVQEIAVNATISCHPLAKPVLVKHDERVLITKTAMHDFLKRSGVPDDHRERLMNMYMIGKQTFPPMRVDDVITDGQDIDGVMKIHHVPGHAPGLIMIEIEDVLITTDHILPETSVALAPESIMPYTGVGHYLLSLQKAMAIDNVRLALGGHENEVDNYAEVALKTYDGSLQKVNRVLDMVKEPMTVYQLACKIYQQMDGYGELLRIEQTGARVEYLNQRGVLMIDNLEALEQEFSPALKYKRV